MIHTDSGIHGDILTRAFNKLWNGRPGRLVYSKLNISVNSCSFFLKFSGKMRVNMSNTLGNFLGKTPCVKKVIVF